jgi:hypothetical protein
MHSDWFPYVAAGTIAAIIIAICLSGIWLGA